MNAKKAKRIRQALRLHGYDTKHAPTVEDASLPGTTGTERLQPDSGRSVYRTIKKLGFDPLQQPPKGQ